MPSSNTIQLFFCPLNTDLLDEKTVATVRSWLPENELLKVDRFIQQSAQEQGLMVRGYLRAVLSRFADIKPQQWQFEYGEKGKPRLSTEQLLQTGLQFNLSHSGDWLLIGVLDTHGHGAVQVELGVDIERRRESTNIHSILHHYFSKPEETALLALPESQQRERFFDLWALKESYIKAKGLGLALSLKSFAFDLSAPSYVELFINDKPISVQQHIPLSVLNSNGQDEPDAMDKTYTIAPGWRCYLGHFDHSYRFAVSLRQINLNQNVVVTPSEISSKLACAIELKAKKISWSELVAC